MVPGDQEPVELKDCSGNSLADEAEEQDCIVAAGGAVGDGREGSQRYYSACCWSERVDLRLARWRTWIRS
jgi:hypothetical protein